MNLPRSGREELGTTIMTNHSDEKILPDDLRLTAYALGELEGTERAIVEAALDENAELRASVESIRATVAQLEGALATESLPAVSELKQATDAKAGTRPGRGVVLRFPQAYFVVSGLAAACFMVFVILRDPEAKPLAAVTERKVYTVLNLPLGDSAVAEEAEQRPPERRPTAEAPELVAVPPKTVTFQISGSVQSAARAPIGPVEVLSKDLSRLAQSEAVSMQAKTTTAAQPTRKLASNGAGGRGVALRAETGFQKSSGFVATKAGVIGGDEKRALVGVGGRVRVADEMARKENYAQRKDSDFLRAAENPLSTFAADVDTASYANVRRMLRAGHKPPVDAVRVEELVNYFPYRYPAPNAGGDLRGGGTPPTGAERPAFAAALEVAEAPWSEGHRLVRIGLKAREVAASARGAANLVFLVDVSGSMSGPERLPLVQESLRLLVSRLRPDDRVAIVTYAGAAGLALASTPVVRAREIVDAIAAMTPGGATNGGMGIQLAYDIAKANFVAGGVNRVILCTDGDFNVGVTGEGELVRLIQEKAKSGVFLTVLGFGMGNLKDSMLEAIADKGNGSYGYIDSRREAEKLLGAQVNGTLATVAKDVKLQVEFNPARVGSYRLIGYENRMLAKEDFNNDKVDAGEIGAGHTMTALYEIVPTTADNGLGVTGEGRGEVDALKYSRPPARVATEVASGELLTVKVRYKEPDGDVSRKLEFALTDAGERFADASGDFKFASAVAAFGMILRDSPHKGTATLDEVATWAEAGAADDPGGWRGEFVELARAADSAR
jgi:Ca-activated chloride channel family protein